MLRHPRSAACLLALAAGLVLAGCGTKGPLVPAPKPDAAAGEAAKPGTADKRTEPKL